VWKVRAARVILATGATERHLAFPDNDRPGVMLFHAALEYAHGFGVMPGRRAVVLTNNSGAYANVASLEALGLDVAAIVDMRHDAPEADGNVMLGQTIVAVRGKHTVRGVDVAPLNALSRHRFIDCDLVLVSGGWMLQEMVSFTQELFERVPGMVA